MSKKAFTHPNRRNVLAGISAGLALSAVPSAAISLPAELTSTTTGRKHHAGSTLAKHLCGEVHGKMAARLDEIIADPAIDGEQTSLALMEAHCPGCGQRVEPATSRISAVIPQWKQHFEGPQKFGVSA